MIHGLGRRRVGAWIGSDATSNQADRRPGRPGNPRLRGHSDRRQRALLAATCSRPNLIGYIGDVKSRLAAAQVSIPVTTADVYSVLLANPDVVNAVDVVYVNYYPFWEATR